MADDVVFPDGRSGSKYWADLCRLIDAAAAGEAPSAEELSAAPILRGWHLSHIGPDPELEKLLGGPACQIWGFFECHPYIADGEWGHTSPVLQIAPDHTWARCTSRTYRLSMPAAETGLDLNGNRLH